MCAGDPGSYLQECDEQTAGDEQSPQDAFSLDLQLQGQEDLQGLQHAYL